MAKVTDEEIIRVTKGWAGILRRHSRESRKGTKPVPTKTGKVGHYVVDPEGWEVLSDHLLEAAKLLEWFAKERASR